MQHESPGSGQRRIYRLARPDPLVGGNFQTMRDAALALAAGAVVGCGYALAGIRSPAPPVLALVGLLGMLGGEWAVSRIVAHLHEPSSVAAHDK